MARRLVWTLIMVCFGVLSNGNADARRQPVPEPKRPASIGVASPTLAPFQHVRFCLRYPSDCASNPTDEDRISVTEEVTKLLKKVNRTVNSSIVPTRKNHSTDLADGWTIAPERGDCNDFAVTKRHMLLELGLPSKALRLSVVRTTAGRGHLVLVVATTRGDIVLDNLTDAILGWGSTDYAWLKIQSADDAQLWYDVKIPGRDLTVAQAGS